MPPRWGLVLIVFDHYKDTAPNGAPERGGQVKRFASRQKSNHAALVRKFWLSIGCVKQSVVAAIDFGLFRSVWMGAKAS